jgi:hypothetical protein
MAQWQQQMQWQQAGRDQMAVRQWQQGGPAPGSAEEIEAKLTKLQALFQKGLISQQDYDRKREELMSQM